MVTVHLGFQLCDGVQSFLKFVQDRGVFGEKAVLFILQVFDPDPEFSGITSIPFQGFLPQAVVTE